MQFLYTNVLFFMLLPAFLLMYLILTKENKFTQYFSKDTLEKLSLNNQYFSSKARNITLFLSLILMIIALARPVTNEQIHNTKQELNAMVIAIDVSKSMLANDIYPNRLEFSKKKLLDIINKSPNSAIAVILFAKNSFILSPLTQDFKSLKILVENLDTGLNFDNGTNIYSTLETANKLLKNYTSKNLVLLSDGADKEDFEEEISYANEHNINIYTIAIATKRGAAIKEKDGNYLTNKKGEIITVKLNENIKNLSLDTKGGYINYSLNTNDIDEILEEIANKSSKNEFKSKRFKTYTELFYYPLALAVFLLLIAFSSLPKFKKTSKEALILALIFLSYQDIKASVLDFKTIDKANTAYEKSEYNTASKEYGKLPVSDEQQYNLANSYYKNKEFKKAIKAYENVKSENRDLNYQKQHNIGNSYVKSGDLQSAKKAYEEALKIKNDTQTKENLDLVNKALKKQNKKENKQNKKQNKKNQDQKKKQEDKKKNQNQKSKDQKKEDSKQKNKEKQKDKKKNSQQSKNKNKDDKSKKAENKQGKKQVSQKEISDLEEKKWLKKLENQKTHSLLKKMKSDKNTKGENPW